MMDEFWKILVAGGLAGAVAAFVNQVLGDIMESRRQKRQLRHEGELQLLAQSHEVALQAAEGQHQSRLRQEAAHAKAAEWSVPLVAQCLYWVELQRAQHLGRDITAYVRAAPDLATMTESSQVLRAVFRLATEHPSAPVRNHAKELYEGLSNYYGPHSDQKDGSRSDYFSEPSTESLDHWTQFLEWLLPHVHPVEQ